MQLQLISIDTIVLSLSGGRTSHYMLDYCLNNRQKIADWIGVPEPDLKYIFVFANTGFEHNKTLDYVKNTELHYGIKIIWLEGVPVFGERVKTGFRITNYEDAFRVHQYKDENHPFHMHIRKYGVPNNKYVSCTREMKINTINSYLDSIGLNERSNCYTAIGIRNDESQRKSGKAHERNLIYPLVDLIPTDEPTVLAFWAKFEWDLGIPRHNGNCVMCYEKCSSNLERAYNDDPLPFQAVEWYEEKYGFVGPEFEKKGVTEPRAFFRGNEYSHQMIARFELAKIDRNERGISDIAEHHSILADERKQAKAKIAPILKRIKKRESSFILEPKWLIDNWGMLSATSLDQMLDSILVKLKLNHKSHSLTSFLGQYFDEIGYEIEIIKKQAKKENKSELLTGVKVAKHLIKLLYLGDSQFLEISINDLLIQIYDIAQTQFYNKCLDDKSAFVNSVMSMMGSFDISTSLVSDMVAEIVFSCDGIKYMSVSTEIFNYLKAQKEFMEAA